MMTDYPHLFGNPKEDLDQLCANIVKFRREAMIQAIEEGKNCDQDFMLSCLGLLDTMINEISKNPDVMMITGISSEDSENYFHHKFKHLVENKTEASKKLDIKKTEVALIFSCFKYFINNKVTINNKESTLRAEFKAEFLEWYRTPDGQNIDEKSVRDYIKEKDFNFGLSDYLFDFNIKQNKELLLKLFNRNDIYKFSAQIKEVNELFCQFHEYIIKQ